MPAAAGAVGATKLAKTKKNFMQFLPASRRRTVRPSAAPYCSREGTKVLRRLTHWVSPALLAMIIEPAATKPGWDRESP